MSLVNLSLIIPVFIDGKRGDEILVRLRALLESFSRYGIELVVPDGSKVRHIEVRAVCEEFGGRYLCTEEGTGVFSPGVARNVGAQYASRDFILFYDVDLFPSRNFFSEIERLINSDWRAHSEFHMFPCLYLNRAASLLVQNGNAEIDDYFKQYLAGDLCFIENFVTATSVLLMKRTHFLFCGGFSKEFSGHGCEDLELLNRLTWFWPIAEREADYLEDRPQTTVNGLKGFRRHFFLYAVEALCSSAFVAHLWHDKPVFSSYLRSRTNNEKLLPEAMAVFNVEGTSPAVLSDLSNDEQVAVSVDDSIEDQCSVSIFLPLIGNYVLFNKECTNLPKGVKKTAFIGKSSQACQKRIAGDSSEESIEICEIEPGHWEYKSMSHVLGREVSKSYRVAKKYFENNRNYRFLLDGSLPFDDPQFEKTDQHFIANTRDQERLFEAGLRSISDSFKSELSGFSMNPLDYEPRSTKFIRKLRKLVRSPKKFIRDIKIVKRMGK